MKTYNWTMLSYDAILSNSFTAAFSFILSCKRVAIVFLFLLFNRTIISLLPWNPFKKWNSWIDKKNFGGDSVSCISVRSFIPFAAASVEEQIQVRPILNKKSRGSEVIVHSVEHKQHPAVSDFEKHDWFRCSEYLMRLLPSPVLKLLLLYRIKIIGKGGTFQSFFWEF